MAYQALYRKYRLSSFDDMVGQDHISNTIKNAIKQNKISHAYLFTGPRGTGKTSIAKLVARAVNCTGDDVLCGVCETCQEIMNNQVSDIIEIDAASNNGVDEIRDIRDKVKYAPSSCKYKVYIIDETHMLTTQAFNALLKTLEEPPKHVIFILATTEPHKIPLTILSRCQRFDFRKISENAIVKRLDEVVEKENILITNDALKLIAYLSDGGMRDALSLLDQVSSYISEEIVEEDIYNITGTATKDAVENVIKAVLTKNKTEVLHEINSLNRQGKDLMKLCDSLTVYLRDAMVSANGIKNDLIYKNSPVFESVCNLSVEQIYEMIRYLSDVLFKLKTVHNPKIYLEVSLLNLIELVNEEIDEIVLTNLDTSALFGDGNNEDVTAKQILEKKGIVVHPSGEFDVNLESQLKPNENLAADVVSEVAKQEVIEEPLSEMIEQELIEEPVTEMIEQELVEEPVAETVDEIEELTNEVVEALKHTNDEVEEIEQEDEDYIQDQSVEEFEMGEFPGAMTTDDDPVIDNSAGSFDDEQKSMQDLEETVVDAGESPVNENEITEVMKKKYYNYLRGVRINNTLANAKKEILTQHKANWELIGDYHVEASKAHLLNIIIDSKIRAASTDHLIISVPTEMTIIKVMNNIKDVENIVADVIKVPGYKVTAVSEVEWSRLKDNYIKKMKLNQSYDMIEEQDINHYYNVKDERKELLEKASNYFGSDSLIVED